MRKTAEIIETRTVLRVERQAWGCVVIIERHEHYDQDGSQTITTMRLREFLLQVGSYADEYRIATLRDYRRAANDFAERLAKIIDFTEVQLAED